METKIVLRVFVTLLLVACLRVPGLAQIQQAGIPISFSMKSTADVQTVTMPAIDVPALLKEDSLNAQQGIRLQRFGYGYTVDYDLNNSGTWEKLNDGGRLWRFRINCPGAYSINLIYDDFWLPKGARLFIYNEDRSMVIGAFTEKNNTDNRRFGTRLVKGGVTILEYYEPAHVEQPGVISIERVVYGYRDIFGWADKDFGDSAPCNINIICPGSEPWFDQRRSVAMFLYLAGFKGCSGTMINQNVPDGERERYFLTAGHCDVPAHPVLSELCPTCDIGDVMFYFNYESPVCSPSENGPTDMTVYGSEIVVKEYTYRDWGAPDFMLLRIGNEIPPDYRIYYNGWDAQNNTVPSAIGIHHPRSDVKKITFFESGTQDSYTYWDATMDVVNNKGTVDHCSSGSPLIETANGRVIGIAITVDPSPWDSDPATYDDPNLLCDRFVVRDAVYWKFGLAMGSPGDPGRLRYYLDPDHNVPNLGGYDTYHVDAAIILIDRTGSMNLDIPAGGTRFERAKVLAKADASDLLSNFPGVEVAVYSFYTDSDGGTYFCNPGVHGFSIDINDVHWDIDDIDPPEDHYHTPLAQAMMQTADILKSMSSYPFRSLYIYTDGYENNSVHPDSPDWAVCGGMLGGDPVSAHWYPDCDPFDNDPVCDDYQTCLSTGFDDRAIINVRYFGQQITKQGVSVEADLQDRPHISAGEIPETAYAGSDDKSLLNLQLPEYKFLQYIADRTRGAFTFECDENQPPVALCRDVTFFTNTDCAADVSINFGSYDPDGDPITIDLDPPPPYRLGQTLVTLTATDPEGLSSTCQATVTVVTHLVKIAKIHNALQGHFENVSITLENDPFEFGGFDFLIAYDASALAFIEASPGQLLEDCDWEYFTYRYGATGNCGDACPSGLIRIIALAETSNGPYHPSCYGPPDADPHELAVLTFYITNNRTFDCQYTPIRFFWTDCGDNAISSVGGEDLYVSKCIFNFDGFDSLNIADDAAGFPTYLGVQQECFDFDPAKPSPLRWIDFVNGGIDIICSDSIDVKCDINLNGIPYEIADAVLLVDCMMNPRSCGEASIAASDCNGDGMPMSIADLVHLIRVITGDALPDPKVSPYTPEAAIDLQVNHSATAVAISSPVDIGGGYFEFAYSGYNIGEPHLINGASDMTIEYGVENGVLRVIVYSMEKGRKISAGTENVFAIPISGNGSITLADAELSDYYGNIVAARIEGESILPADYVLHQSYPNPFNATTTIMYELPVATHVKLDVYNTLGQRVTTLVDREETAGIHSVDWDGTNASGETVASGVYFYRITSAEFTAEKKMILMK